MEVAEYFRLNAKEAATVVKQVKHTVGGWRKWAATLHIPKEEQEMMAVAFGGRE